MGLISRLPRPKAAMSKALEELILSVYGGGSTSSGIAVSSDTAMRQATVYSCVNVLSRVFGMLPCHLMKQQGNMREKAIDHDLYPLLHDMPNEWMTSAEFWGMSMVHRLTTGNFYAIKNRGLSLSSPVREIIPLAPGIVQEVEQLPNYKLVYKCTFPDGTRKDIPGSEIMHLRGMVINGYMGVNPITYIRESIGLGLATLQFGARTFSKGTFPSMIVEHPGSIKDTKALREALSDTYAGLDNSHRIMLLEEGMKATNVSISAEDSQFLETRRYQKEEIVDIFFGMPLTVMNSGGNTPTFASAEQFSIGFVVYALMPWIVETEKAVYRDLLTIADRKSHYLKFQVKGLQRGSFKEQMESYQIAINTEILSPNEAREDFDLNPYEGGDEYRTRTSTVKEPTKQKKRIGVTE